MHDDFVFEFYRSVAIYSLIPGFFGALCLWAFHIREKSYGKGGRARKLGIEVLGGTLLATFLGQAVPTPRLQVAGSFLLGLSWVLVIRALRKRTDRIVGSTVEKVLPAKKEEISDGTQSPALDRPDEPERS